MESWISSTSKMSDSYFLEFFIEPSMMGEAFAFDSFFDAAKLYIMPFPCTNVNFYMFVQKWRNRSTGDRIS